MFPPNVEVQLDALHVSSIRLVAGGPDDWCGQGSQSINDTPSRNPRLWYTPWYTWEDAEMVLRVMMRQFDGTFGGPDLVHQFADLASNKRPPRRQKAMQVLGVFIFNPHHVCLAIQQCQTHWIFFGFWFMVDIIPLP